ncbi:YpiB family protein [Staphylococcus durrellii]|uniref:YpiB family protein n=1 Tax=Staphylococcus durrellii TaxID=2781773 RepID=UPI00189CC253|nr:YpiB family protein [Staphylococcus durrellii]MBF7017089.1 YpiB family protein [Staphylococcus durrellii]
MTTSLNQMKTNFIEYLLFQYEFKSRISVWVLNYIKSSTQQIENLHFVYDRITNHNTLELSIIDAKEDAITLKTTDSTLINSNEIFTFIANSNLSLDIKINFAQNSDRERRLDELLVYQLLKSPYYTIYMNDIYTIPLSTHYESSIIQHLQDNIDLSLQFRQPEQFYQLSQILKLFKSRNSNP